MILSFPGVVSSLTQPWMRIDSSQTDPEELKRGILTCAWERQKTFELGCAHFLFLEPTHRDQPVALNVFTLSITEKKKEKNLLLSKYHHHG